MIDYIVRYTDGNGNPIWAKARSFSKRDVFSIYRKQPFVRHVHNVLTIPELLQELSKRQIII